LLQIALGLPFRQDHRPAPAPNPAPVARPGADRPNAARPSLGRPGTAQQASIRTEARATRGFRRRSQPWYQRALNVVNRYWSAFVGQAAVVQSRPATLSGLASAAAVAVVIAATGPAAAMALNRGAATDFPATLRPIAFTGACTADPDRPTEQHDGVGRLWVEHLKCGQAAFALRLQVFPPRARPSEIIAELRELSGGPTLEATRIIFLPTPEGPRTWRIQELDDPASTVATSLWIDGRPAQVTFDMRVHRAWASVVGSGYAPIAISLTPELDWSKPNAALRNRARDLIALFVQTYQSMPDQIAKLSYAAAH
jgi:hypothetical protein